MISARVVKGSRVASIGTESAWCCLVNFYDTAIIVRDDRLRAVERSRSDSQARFEIRRSRIRGQRGSGDERLPQQGCTHDNRLRDKCACILQQFPFFSPLSRMDLACRIPRGCRIFFDNFRAKKRATESSSRAKNPIDLSFRLSITRRLMDRGKRIGAQKVTGCTNLGAGRNCCWRSCRDHGRREGCSCESGGFNRDAGVPVHDRVKTVDRIGRVGDDGNRRSIKL